MDNPVSVKQGTLATRLTLFEYNWPRLQEIVLFKVQIYC